MPLDKSFGSRWQSSSGQALFQDLLSAWRHQHPLKQIANLQQINGRWDVRGLDLTERVGVTQIRSFSLLSDAFEFKNLTIKHVDFSHSKLGYSYWKKCRFEDCLFSHASFKEIQLTACHFERCHFQHSNLSYAYLGEHSWSDSGSYIDCTFDTCNLSESTFDFPLFRHCLFKDCKLVATFYGSRLESCKFVGMVEEPNFWGYAVMLEDSFISSLTSNFRQFPNRMYQVDFSEAELYAPNFAAGVDLSTCIFPDDPEKYLFIPDQQKLYSTALAYVEAHKGLDMDWPDSERDILLRYLRGTLDLRGEQKSFFISFDMHNDTLFPDPKLARDFFNLLRKICEAM